MLEVLNGVYSTLIVDLFKRLNTDTADISFPLGKLSIPASLYDKWFGVFDVNILTDQFYKELQNWFYWASSVIDTPLLNTETATTFLAYFLALQLAGKENFP